MNDQDNRQRRTEDAMQEHTGVPQPPIAGVIDGQCRNDQQEKHPFHGEPGNPIRAKGPAVTNVLAAKVAEYAAQNWIQAAVEQSPEAQPGRRHGRMVGEILAIPERETGNKTQQERADDYNVNE